MIISETRGDGLDGGSDYGKEAMNLREAEVELMEEVELMDLED